MKKNFLDIASELFDDRSRISEKTKDNICNDYLTLHDVRVKDLCKKHNMSPLTFERIRKKRGIPKRPPMKFKTKYSINENFFENIDTERKAYWLGILLGDGAVKIKKETWSYHLVYGISKNDEELIKKFQNDIESNYPIRYEQPSKGGIVSVLDIPRKKICLDLVKNGVCPNKSKECKLPNFIEILMAAYLRGVTDSDGYFYISKSGTITWGMCSSVKSFVIEVRNYIASVCGLNANVKIKCNHGTCFHVRYVGNIQCKKIFEWLYKDHTICLERKYLKAKNHFDYLEKNPKVIGRKTGLKNKTSNFEENEDFEESEEEEFNEITNQFVIKKNFLDLFNDE